MGIWLSDKHEPQCCQSNARRNPQGNGEAESRDVCKREARFGRKGVLVVENNVEKRTVNFKLPVIADETQLSESVHEKVNP